MDLQMPQMDGYQATQQIREVLKSEIPIIAMTAHAMAGEREKCISRGMNEYISKPVNEHELFNLISQFGLKQSTVTSPYQQNDKPAFQYIDLSYMQSVSGGNTDFEQTVTQQFIDNLPPHLEELTAAYQNQNFAGVKLRAHDMKSSVAIMGLLPLLQEKLELLENTADQNPMSEKALEEVKTSFYLLFQKRRNSYSNYRIPSFKPRNLIFI